MLDITEKVTTSAGLVVNSLKYETLQVNGRKRNSQGNAWTIEWKRLLRV